MRLLPQRIAANLAPWLACAAVLLALPGIGQAWENPQPAFIAGELIDWNAATRNGSFRREGTDEVLNFQLAAGAVLRQGDVKAGMPGFPPGERLLFSVVSGGDRAVSVVRVEDEAVLMRERGQCWHIEAIDLRRWPRLQCTWADREKREVVSTNSFLEISPETRLWRAGRPIRLEDVRVGERLTARTGGVGFGQVRIAWDLYLEDLPSLSQPSQP